MYLTVGQLRLINNDRSWQRPHQLWPLEVYVAIIKQSNLYVNIVYRIILDFLLHITVAMIRIVLVQLISLAMFLLRTKYINIHVWPMKYCNNFVYIPLQLFTKKHFPGKIKHIDQFLVMSFVQIITFSKTIQFTNSFIIRIDHFS